MSTDNYKDLNEVVSLRGMIAIKQTILLINQQLS